VALHSDHGYQVQSFVAFAAGLRGEDHECLGLVGVEEGLAVEFDQSDFGVDDAFRLAVEADDGVGLPDGFEFVARLSQRVQLRASWARIARRRRPAVR